MPETSELDAAIDAARPYAKSNPANLSMRLPKPTMEAAYKVLNYLRPIWDRKGYRLLSVMHCTTDGEIEIPILPDGIGGKLVLRFDMMDMTVAINDLGNITEARASWTKQVGAAPYSYGCGNGCFTIRQWCRRVEDIIDQDAVRAELGAEEYDRLRRIGRAITGADSPIFRDDPITDEGDHAFPMPASESDKSNTITLPEQK